MLKQLNNNYIMSTLVIVIRTDALVQGCHIAENKHYESDIFLNLSLRCPVGKG